MKEMKKKRGFHRVITDAEKQNIIALTEIEPYQSEIAKKVGVSTYTVWKVLKEHRQAEKNVFDVEQYARELATI